MPVVGIAEVLVRPVFNNVQNQISMQMNSAADRAGRDAGGRAGRGFGQGFVPALAAVTGGLAVIPPAAGAASSALLATGGSVLTLTTSLSSLAGVAALVPAGLMSIAAGAGTLFAAFSGVGDALKTAVDASNVVATANPRLAAMAVEDALQGIADAEKNAAEASESAARKVEDAKRSLADAEANAADVRVSAARKVADAERSLADAVESAAEAQVAAARSVEMATRSEAKAARDVIKAQKELVKAREEAAKRVDQTGSDLRSAELVALNTTLAHTKAVEAYNKAVSDGISGEELLWRKNDIDKAKRADNDAKLAVLDLSEAHRKAQSAAEDSNDKLLTAEQRLDDARQAQADAIQNRQDAQANVTKTELRGARQIGDAQQNLADSTKEAEKARVDAARSIADAQQGVTDANRAAEKAQLAGVRAITDAYRNLERVQLQQADSGAAAGKKAAAAMDKLTPSGQEAVKALLAVKDQLGQIRNIAQENFFRGFTAPLMSLAGSVMPQLATGVGAIASAFGEGAQIFMRVLESSLGNGVLESLLVGVAKSAQILNGAIAPVVESFTTLGVVGMPYMSRLSDLIVVIATKFNEFIQTTAADGRLVAWIDAGIQALKDLWSIAGSVVGVFLSLNDAAVKGGLNLTVADLAAGMKNLDDAMHSPTFQTVMTTLFSGAAAGAEGLRGALDNIGAAFVRGAPAMSEFMRLGGEIAGTFIGGIFDAFSDPTFGAGLLTFMGGLQRGAEAIAPLLPGMFAALGQVLTAMAPIAEAMGPAMVVVLTNLATGLAAVLSFIAPLLTYFASSPEFMTVMTVALGILVVAWKLLGVESLIAGGKMALAWLLGLGPVGLVIGAVLALVGLIIVNWDTISRVTRELWENNVKPVFDALGNFITKDVPKAFEDGVKFIKTAWEKLQDIAKAPVRFVVETVINDGLINGLNGIGGFLGLPQIPRLGLPSGFANGGYTGDGGKYEPAGIVHAGEFVFTKEQTQRAGVANLYAMADALAGYAKGGLVRPVLNSVISQPFSGSHNGIDFAAPIGTPVGAAGPGRVSSAGWSSYGGGNEIHIDHPNGLQTWYAHLSSFAVKLGDMVSGGSKIGEVGSTGNSTGPHLHYMVLDGGWPSYMDPAPYLDGGGESGSGGGWNPLAGIIDGLVNQFKEAFPGAGFFADMAIGAGKKLFDGALDFITGKGGRDKGIGTTSLPYLHDQGGVLNPGLSSIVNATRKPEAILNAQQWADVHKLAVGDGPRGGVNNFTINQVDDPIGTSYAVQRRLGALAV